MVLVLVAGIVVVSGIAASRDPSTTSISGSVTVRGMVGLVYVGDGCSNPSVAGRSVTVYDDGGTIVGTTTLTGAGLGVDQDGSRVGYADACEYSYSVPDVPTGSKFFRITTGGSSQGVTFSAADAAGGADIVVDS